MQFLARPVLNIIKGKFFNIDWEKILKKSEFATYIPDMFSVIQYKCGPATLSLYRSGITTAAGKIDFEIANEAIKIFSEFLQRQDLHDGAFDTDPVVANSVYQLLPVKPVKINLKALMDAGGMEASVFHAVDIKLDSGSTARVYSSGAVTLKGTRSERLIQDVKNITTILEKHKTD